MGVRGRKGPSDQRGFTLVELLVILLIIAILAGIAIPVFLAQRNKARVASAQRSLKDAALAAEAYGADNGGDYSGLDDDPDPLLELRNHGFNPTANIEIGVTGETDTYCILAQSVLLGDSPPHDWYYATYEPSDGRPTEADTCEDSSEEDTEEIPLDLPTLPACLPPVLVPPLCE